MVEEQAIEQVINDQKENLFHRDSGILRNIDFNRLTKSNQIIVITGVRRSGKSTLLHQIANLYNEFNYINFDDERLFNFELSDFQKLMIIFKKKSTAKVIFIDEIQNVPSWERFVRRIYDEDYKIYITGSNSKLLSSELATHLTGRYIKIELFPFSFVEYLKSKSIETKPLTSDNQANILNAFDEYLFYGGFPGFHKNEDLSYIQNIFEDIIYKDLIGRFEIRNIKAFKQLAHFLLSSFTKEISYNSLKNTLQISNVNTIKDYIDYLQQSYLVFECYKFDYSLKKQMIYNKKIYTIDNGMQKSVSFSFSNNHGQLLENMVYLELRRTAREVYFYKTRQNHEVDFVVQQQEISIFQVCYSIDDKKTIEREKQALIEAMKELNLRNSTILTYNHNSTITTEFGQISMIPAWKWLIGY